MALQVKCCYCEKLYLSLSGNTKVVSLELDWQRIEIECPHCKKVNSVVLQPIKKKFDKLQQPEEAKDERFFFLPTRTVSLAVVRSKISPARANLEFAEELRAKGQVPVYDADGTIVASYPKEDKESQL